MRKTAATDVGVVVVNWNSLWFTSRCLDSLRRTIYDEGELHVVVVDNGSVDGSLERLRAAHPWVRFVANDFNVGFAEACNRGIRALGRVDAVALVNNDAVVEAGWLTPLIAAMTADDSIGAVAPLLILDPGFVRVEVELDCPSRLVGVEVDGDDLTRRCLVDGGALVGNPEWPLETHYEIQSSAIVWVPASSRAVNIELNFAAVDRRGRAGAVARVGELQSCVAGIDGACRVSIAAGNQRTELVNGLGTQRTDAGEWHDAGFGLPVDSINPSEIDGFCGGGVLLRREMLDKVGLFDPRFFAYYEDSDLSWRIRRSGWSIEPVAESRIRHAFGGSGGSGAPWFFFLNYRNWALTVIRNGTSQERHRAGLQVREWLRSAIRQNVFAPIARFKRPSWRLVSNWTRVGLGTARELPRVLRERCRRHRNKPVVPLGHTPVESVRIPFGLQPEDPEPRPRPGGPRLLTIDRALFDSGVIDAAQLVELDAEPLDEADLAIVEWDQIDSRWIWSPPTAISTVLGDSNRRSEVARRGVLAGRVVSGGLAGVDHIGVTGGLAPPWAGECVWLSNDDQKVPLRTIIRNFVGRVCASEGGIGEKG